MFTLFIRFVEFWLNVLMMVTSSMGSGRVHSVSLMTPCNKNIEDSHECYH